MSNNILISCKDKNILHDSKKLSNLLSEWFICEINDVYFITLENNYIRFSFMRDFVLIKSLFNDEFNKNNNNTSFYLADITEIGLVVIDKSINFYIKTNNGINIIINNIKYKQEIINAFNR